MLPENSINKITEKKTIFSNKNRNKSVHSLLPHRYDFSSCEHDLGNFCQEEAGHADIDSTPTGCHGEC